MIRLLFFILIHANFKIISSAFSDEATPLSDVLNWKYSPVNPTCTDANGGRNPCQDVRICSFAVVSLMLGGWPTLCDWVGKGVPKVCCGLPLVLGGGLMAKIETEKSRKRECGRRTMSRGLSETENKFFEILKTIPPIDTSNPEHFDPPLDLSVEHMISSMRQTTSRQGDFPWMVAIYRGTSFLCGGALIDRIHILSAAHCFVSQSRLLVDPSLYSVHVGNINVDGGFPFAVAKIKIHEDYSRNQHYSDIAILTLPEEILQPFIAHICLPDEALEVMDFKGKNTTFLGWEKDNTEGRNSPSLRIVDDIPLVSTNKCKPPSSRSSNAAYTYDLSDEFLCAGNPSRRNTCQIDSGDILMYKNNYQNLPHFHPDIPWVLVGISSSRCDESGSPGVYTRIPSHMDWIIRNTNSSKL